jgi:hypothetical protein
VSQNVGELLHRRAGVDEPGCERVAEDVNTASVPAEPGVGGMQGLLHDTSPDRLAEWRDMADEHLAPIGRGSLVHDIIDDRFAGY